LESSSYI